MDDPITGTKPEGLGRLAVVVASTFVGLMLGLSLVYLLAPWQEAQRGRRASDRMGRRASDRTSDVPDRPVSTDPADAEISTASPTITLEFNSASEQPPSFPR